MSFLNSALAGQAVGAMGTSLQAAGQATSLRSAALVDEENARRAILAGEQEAAATMKRGRNAMGETLAQLASGGGGIGGGTAGDLMTASALDVARDVAAIRTKAQYQSAGLLDSAAAKRSEARMAMINGVFGTVGGVLKAQKEEANRNRMSAAIDHYQGVLGGGGLTPATSAGDIYFPNGGF